RVEPGIGRWHLAVGERHAVEKTDHALGHGTQVMRDVARESDRAEPPARTILVLAGLVVLENDFAMLRHEQRMQATKLLAFAHERETAFECACCWSRGGGAQRTHDGSAAHTQHQVTAVHRLSPLDTSHNPHYLVLQGTMFNTRV